MQNIQLTLGPNQAMPVQVRGVVLQVIDTGEEAITVQFLQGGQVAYEVDDVTTGWKVQPFGGFTSLNIIAGASGGNFSAIVTNGDIDIQLLSIGSTIANTPANPVPVSIVSEPGAPVPVTGTVQVTGANLVASNVQLAPGGAAVTELGAMAVPVGAATHVITATAGRKRAVIYNAGAGRIGLGGAPGLTFASAAIVLQPGDAWRETDAPQLDWYAVSDTGSSVNIQVVS